MKFDANSVPQGWCGSADPRKRQFETKHSEADEMRKEIEEIKMTKEMEHLDRTSSVSSDFHEMFKINFHGMFAGRYGACATDAEHG